MNKIHFNYFVKKNRFPLAFFVLFSLFMSSENLFAQNFNIKEYVDIEWSDGGLGILFDATVYDYSLGRNKHKFLKSCKFEFSVNNEHYTKLIEIKIPKQKKANTTEVFFFDKLSNALFEFDRDFKLNGLTSEFWTENTNKGLGIFQNEEDEAVLAFIWRLNSANKNVRYIRISGKWIIEEKRCVESFCNVVYDLNRPNQSMLQSNILGINTEVSGNDTAKILKESEAILIKGAEPGVNIKVYTTSGVETKSVISNNDVVKIKLPAKQIYLVHIGNSRYKVAL